MKRIISLLLCAMLMLSICACDDKNDKDKKESTTPDQSVSEAAVATVDQTAPAATEISDTELLKMFISEFDKTPVMDEQVIFEDDKFTVSLNALAYDRINGPELQLKVVSKFEKDVIMQCPYMVVNGYMIEPDDEKMSEKMEMPVPAGKTTEGVINIPYFYLAISGINTVETIEFPLEFCEPDTYNVLQTTPLLSLKSSAEQNEKEGFDDEGLIAYDKDGIKIVIKGLNIDHTYTDDDKLIVSMLNDTDREIIIKAKELSVNGYDKEDFIPKMHPLLLPGTRATNFVRILQKDKQAHGIDEIENIEVAFVICTTEGDLIASTELMSLNLTEPDPLNPATLDSAELKKGSMSVIAKNPKINKKK